MSAFVVSNLHINSMVEFARINNGLKHTFSTYWKGERYSFNLWEPEEAAKLGNILMDENVRSVNFRYSSGEREENFYKYQRPEKKLTPVEMLKVIACYDYQSCETDDWEQSLAYKICQALKNLAIRSLDGYSEAPWGL